LEEMPAEQQAVIARTQVVILGLPVLLGLASFVSAGYWGGRLTLTAAGIGVSRRGRLFGSAHLPAQALAEVRVGKSNARWTVSVFGFGVESDPNAEILELQLVSRRTIVLFGRGGSRADLEWLRDVILAAHSAAPK